ncbi:archease [Halobellus sp. Atlit-38R]|jgi:SHS2 domain-containing protein|uniref:archease n=1 Tax=Halobellus sp. Atlit-38R TaxID=2282131 RepID=UPI000EF28E70|nr:archease [Halobellus sp. Atlit-38R]RLM89338.1 archease [Halobellus sp. Atlit-38R]
MTYELSEHAVDVKLRAKAGSLELAFAEMVDALSELVGGPTQPQADPMIEKVDLTARDLEALLFDFLNKLVLCQDIENAVVSHAGDVEIHETDMGYHLSATIYATPIEPDQPLLDVKAPTYSQMRIEQDDDGWTIEAVLEV